MNFMPPLDEFVDEPIITPPAVLVPEMLDPAVHQSILESNKRQEELLGKILVEIEKLNKRINLIENKNSENLFSKPSPSPAPSGLAAETRSAIRGSLPLPPGMRHVPSPVAAPPAQMSIDDENKRRTEESARLARVEAERREREAEEVKRRQAEAERVENERRAREELEKKRKELITGLFTTETSTGLFEDDLNVKKNGGGLFDD